MSAVLEKKKAKELITENARDYLTAKVKIPLGNPALKNVHTNQFLFMTFPKEFSLQNWKTIAKALNSSDTRFSGYSKSRWYIEGCTIDVDVKGKAEMSLDLNAFASTTKEFTDGYRALTKAYEDAVNKTVSSTKAKTTSSTKTTTNAVSNGKTKYKNGWWGQWVTNWVSKVCGDTTDLLKRAKLIDAEFKRVTHWKLYYDAQKTNGNPKNYEKAYNSHYLNCADGANILCAMHNCAGIKSTIMHTDSHYIVRMTINGKYWWTDCSASNGQLCNKPFNKVYGYKGGTNVGTKTK
jgi:hypothetical protein